MVRDIRALHRNKVRRSRQQFIIEGVRLLEEALNSDCVVETVLYCSETGADSKLQDLLGQLAKKSNRSIIPFPRSVITRISETTTPPGLVAVVNHPPLPDMAAIVASTDLAVLADRIQDPGNAGTIIRTAEAAGAGGVFLSFGSVYPFASKVIRSAMGSLFRLPVKSLSDEGSKLCQYCLAKGWQLAFAVPDQGIPWWKIDFNQPTLIILGNESSGINGSLLRFPGVKASIQLTAAVESLNVAAAGAVLLLKLYAKDGPKGKISNNRR